jgi:hypothetical protein
MFVRVLELDDMLKVTSESVLRSLGGWIGSFQDGRHPSCLICEETLTARKRPNKFVAVEVDDTNAKVWAVCSRCECRPDFEFDVEVGLEKAFA